MSASENTVYTALIPIRLLSEIFGFCPQVNLRNKYKFTAFGIFHVSTILLLKVFLIYYNADPSKFSKATNSNILNSGLWIQTEASLAISIFYILLGIKKCSDKWKIMEDFHDIDEAFIKSFYVKYHYVQTKHWMSLFIVCGVMIHFMLSIITGYYLWNLPFEFRHRWSICIAIYISNISIYSIANQFICCQFYLSSRFRNINDILSQLIFDEPLSNGLLLTNTKVTGDKGTTISSVKTITQKRRIEAVKYNFIPNVKLAFIQHDEDKAIKVKYPYDKEFPKSVTKSVQQYEEKIFSSLFIIAHKTCITKLAFERSSTLTDTLEKLDKLMELHDRLCDCVDKCNNLLALEVLLISLTICVYVVFGLFARYRVWMDYQYEADNVAKMNIYWIIVYSFFLLLGTYISSNLMQTIQETGAIIHRVACRQQNFVLLNKLSLISQMLYSRKSAVGCGLIVFDWPRVFSLFGSICMYLIILIQFYISGTSNEIQSMVQNNHTDFV